MNEDPKHSNLARKCLTSRSQLFRLQSHPFKPTQLKASKNVTSHHCDSKFLKAPQVVGSHHPSAVAHGWSDDREEDLCLEVTRGSFMFCVPFLMTFYYNWEKGLGTNAMISTVYKTSHWYGTLSYVWPNWYGTLSYVCPNPRTLFFMISSQMVWFVEVMKFPHGLLSLSSFHSTLWVEIGWIQGTPSSKHPDSKIKLFREVVFISKELGQPSSVICMVFLDS